MSKSQAIPPTQLISSTEIRIHQAKDSPITLRVNPAGIRGEGCSASSSCPRFHFREEVDGLGRIYRRSGALTVLWYGKKSNKGT